MHCRALFLARVFLFAISLCVSPDGSAKSAKAPNVILIMTDDQGYGDLSCHGNPILKTPNLDRLHRESIRLTDFHVAPMCTPTRGQLMTGVDALRNGAMNVSSGRTLLRREFPTMPEIFSANKYRTGLFGKWHLGDNYPYRPQDRGFDESLWFPSSHISSAPDFWNNDYFDDVYIRNGVRQQTKGYCTDLFFNETMNWIDSREKKRQPFFCYLALNAPHSPLFVPDKYREPYRDQPPALASFFGMIANIDENMGKLETFLRDRGLRENTIVIFMTDNGTAGGDSVHNAGMRGRKTWLHEGGHRVPFFIRWPAGGLQSPSDIDLLTQSQDILPTLLDLCGLKKPRDAKFDGTSLAKVLRGKAEALPDRMLVTQFSRMDKPVPIKGDAAVLWNKWRLVSNNELYDISQDPAQKHDVVGEFPEVAATMRDHYERWWASVEPEMNEFRPIHIDSGKERTTLLTPCDWQDVFLDQQAQIRRTKRNGKWNLFVERPGQYEFALRRWPVESNTAIKNSMPEHQGVDGVYRAGDALPIAKARLKSGAFDKSEPVAPGELAKSFTLFLKRGRTELQTWFIDDSGKEVCGAYYVYVRRL